MGLDHPPSADANTATAPFDNPPSNNEGPEVSHKFVSFYLDDKHYAVSARAVAEVTGELTSTPLPNSPASLIGIAPHRGDILAIVNTGALSRATISDKRKAIVLRPTGDTVEMPVAFNVDRIGELLQIGSREIKVATGCDPLSDFEVVKGDRTILIVEPSRIVDLLHA